MTVIIDPLTHWLTNLSKTIQNHENIEKGTHIEWSWHDYWHDIGMKNVISSPCFCHGLWVLFRGIGAWLLKGWSQKGASISASRLVDSCGWFCCKYRSTSIFSGWMFSVATTYSPWTPLKTASAPRFVNCLSTFFGGVDHKHRLI